MIHLTDLDKQLATSMTQQLMKPNLHLKRRALPLDKQILEQTHRRIYNYGGVSRPETGAGA